MAPPAGVAKIGNGKANNACRVWMTWSCDVSPLRSERKLPKGYYVFDDAVSSSCIGAAEAVEEVVIREDGLLSEQIYPHRVFRAV